MPLLKYHNTHEVPHSSADCSLRTAGNPLHLNNCNSLPFTSDHPLNENLCSSEFPRAKPPNYFAFSTLHLVVHREMLHLHSLKGSMFNLCKIQRITKAERIVYHTSRYLAVINVLQSKYFKENLKEHFICKYLDMHSDNDLVTSNHPQDNALLFKKLFIR